MKRTRQTTWTKSLTLGVLLLTVAPALVADPNKPATAPEKPSAYAPVKDLEGQISEYFAQIEADLADPGDYGEDQQSRIEKDANTLAALALVLGLHDGDSKLKPSTPALIEAANVVAADTTDYAQTKAALDALQKSLDAAGDPSKLAWKPVANLQQLMKQVPIVNNSLRRGVTGRRFERSIDKTAGHAATLAAIAQVSIFDTDYCADEEDEAKWAKICREMRDASAEVHAAVRKADQDAAKAALAKIVKSCDDCHHAFRD